MAAATSELRKERQANPQASKLTTVRSTMNDKAATRRSFLRTAAGSAAGVSIMSMKTALGSQANSRVKVGCIGLGGRGSMIANMFHEHGGYDPRRLICLWGYFLTEIHLPPVAVSSNDACLDNT